MSSRNTRDDFRMFNYLGQKIKDDALKESACMNPFIRELIGDIHAYALLTGDTSFNEFIPILIIQARYTWQRMEITDLSLMLGENKTSVSFSKSDEPESDDLTEEIAEEDL